MSCEGVGDGRGKGLAAYPCVLSEGWRLPVRGMAETPVPHPAFLNYVCGTLLFRRARIRVVPVWVGRGR